MAQKTRIPVVSRFITKGTAFHRKDLINAFVKLTIVMFYVRMHPDFSLMTKRFFLPTLLWIAIHSMAVAQAPVTIAPKDMKLRIGGSIQTRMTFISNPNLNTPQPESQLGVGVRRARIRLFADVRPDVRVLMQVEGSGSLASFTDLRAEWDVTEKTMLRAGRFAGAQPRGMALTLMFDVDAIDRPAVVEHWARSSMGADGRSFGVELVHRHKDVELRGFLHNGDNSKNLRVGISDAWPTGGTRYGAMATSAMVRVMPSAVPHAEFGVHAGYNPTKSANAGNRTFTDWSAHAYWGDKIGSQPTRLKFDAIGIRYSDIGPMQQTVSGFSLLAAQLIRPDTELFARVERLDTTFDEFSYVTAGASFKLWDWTNKITAAWSMRTDLNPNSDPIHILTLQSQFHF